MNTFIARKSDGSKVSDEPGKVQLGNLNPEYDARFCTCDHNTSNTSEIPDWETAEAVNYIIED